MNEEGLEAVSAREVRRLFKLGGFKLCLETLYFIRDKQARVHLIELNWAQKDFVERVERQLREIGRVKILVLKARQLGLSTVIEGIEIIVKFLTPNCFSLILSYEAKSAEYLYNMGRRALVERWPLGSMPLQRDRLDGMVIGDPVNSVTEVATAKNAGSGRSRTIQFLHASEVAFFENASRLMLGMLQSVPDIGTFVFMETTANGIGNYFHQQWEKAEAGQSSYEPVFYPWHKHPEYKTSLMSPDQRTAAIATYSAEEYELAKNFDLTPEQIKWRRMTIMDKCEGDVMMFRQEYPMNPDEAFIVSGRPVFDPINMKKILDKARRTEPLVRGYLRA